MNRPIEKPLFTFSLTESQRDALACAALSQAEYLQDCHESDEPDVQQALRDLWACRQVLNGGVL